GANILAEAAEAVALGAVLLEDGFAGGLVAVKLGERKERVKHLLSVWAREPAASGQEFDGLGREGFVGVVAQQLDLVEAEVVLVDMTFLQAGQQRPRPGWAAQEQAQAC